MVTCVFVLFYKLLFSVPSASFVGIESLSTVIHISFVRRNHNVKGGLYLANIQSTKIKKIKKENKENKRERKKVNTGQLQLVFELKD